MSTNEPKPWQYLERRPGSGYRQLFFKGTRIRARDLYGQHVGEDGRSVEELAADFGLPVEAIREAIAYVESDPPEIRQDFLREEAIMEATGMNDPDYKYHRRYKPLSPQDWARIDRMFDDA